MFVLFLLILLTLWTGDASANTLAPMFAAMSLNGWLAMPIIIFVEYYFYFRKLKIKEPLRMVVHANVMSGLVGLIPAVLTLNIIPGPAISTYGWSAVTGLVLSVIGTFVHWWFSSAVEFGAIRKHERWRKEKLTFENFKEANKRSYRLILLYFILIHAIPLLRDHG